MNFNTISISVHNNIATVKLNRPDKLNALNKELFDELNEAITSLEADDEVYTIVLTGEGKAFAAGADIGELNASDTASKGRYFSEYGSRVMERLYNLNKPVIGAVNGFALGGGCELAMSCHFRFASEKAKFGQPEVNLGIIPGYGGTQRLTNLIGIGKSMELNLTGNMITADEAKSLSLVNDVYSSEDLLEKVYEICQMINSKGQLAIRAVVETVKASQEMGYRDGLSFESRKFGEICATNDFKEGTTAFLEKRKADFKGN
ncbi:MAG: enoyl-CoA hydratase-related protein [Candidatus Kapaibacteriales bacterium]